MSRKFKKRVRRCAECDGEFIQDEPKKCEAKDLCSCAPLELSYCGTVKAVAELKAKLAERDVLKAVLRRLGELADKANTRVGETVDDALETLLEAVMLEARLSARSAGEGK